MKTALCVPTRNAARWAPAFLQALEGQSLRDYQALAIDSSSDDGSAELFAAAGFRVHPIDPGEFNHGATRRLAAGLCPEAEILVFMTQDAILAAPDSLARLVDAFNDPLVGAAYGRQLPRPGAPPVEEHARFFNYPPRSAVKTAADIPRLGLKTAFISNSFAAYRRAALAGVDGFPENVIIGEDTHAAARMLRAGWKIAYRAAAAVVHSHAYSWPQEWRRYFDTGVFHARHPWLRESFGAAEGEGWRFLRSEIAHLGRRAPGLIPAALLRTGIRYLGFRTGLAERFLPVYLKRRMSAQKTFWGR